MKLINLIPKFIKDWIVSELAPIKTNSEKLVNELYELDGKVDRLTNIALHNKTMEDAEVFELVIVCTGRDGREVSAIREILGKYANVKVYPIRSSHDIHGLPQIKHFIITDDARNSSDFNEIMYNLTHRIYMPASLSLKNEIMKADIKNTRRVVGPIV